MIGTLVLCLLLPFPAPTSQKVAFPGWPGKWLTTVKPVKGEAPMIAPSFTVEQKDGNLYIGMQGDTSPALATEYGVSKSESLLMFALPSGRSGKMMIILRPSSDGRAQLELFVSFPEGSRAKSYYYSELYKKEGPPESP